ncbi:magnesium transporter MgtC [Lactobacillus crispatus]|uniref:MgtC/SapB family protein n=1 Tax=Lactobacillus crispatus TaxID=47770 RepID=UPI0018E3472A|nr:MgtC/SapB family protein [Lactobacillus crispatus]MBI1693855.1 magnesium transporter MgtC [Lactobacillus crispatus]
MKLSLTDIIIRLIIATLIAGIIGWDREQRSHPAGIRTHILVCLGACILALCQIEICIQTLAISRNEPFLTRVITANPARLIAQIVSGIGFLGAGTIVITKHFVTGLTTAASLWVTAALGIVIGMGYYSIALSGAFLVVFVLTVLKRFLAVKRVQQVEIKYYHRSKTNQYLRNYFHKSDVKIKYYNFRINKADMDGNERIYTTIYTLKLPKSLSYDKMLDQLSSNNDIVQINLVTL